MINYYDLTLREASLYQNYIAEGYTDLQIALKLADEKITSRILSTDAEWTKAKRREIQKAIQEEISSAYSGLFEAIQQESVTAAQVVLGATIGQVSVDVPTAAINDLINSQRQIQGYGFKELFDLTQDNHARQLKVLISSGIAQGMTAKQMIDAYAIKSNTLSKGQVTTNIFTVIAESRDQGRYEAYKQLENEGITQGYIFDASLDGRTTQYCREHDQRVYNKPIEDIQSEIKVHFNCRSVFRPKPILSKSNTRASQFGETENESYESWYNKQSDDFKKSTLSNRKYNEYLKGKAQVKGLADLDRPTDLKTVKKFMKEPKLIVNIPNIDLGYKGKYNKHFENITDEAKIIIDKMPKPSKITTGAGGFVWEENRIIIPLDKKLVALHEYGHYLDHSLMSKDGVFLSTTRLKKASDLDVKHLALDFGSESKPIKLKEFETDFMEKVKYTVEKGKYKGMEASKWVAKDEYKERWSGLVDNITDGYFRDKYNASGHGSKYFKSREFLKQTENFADLFSLWSDGTKWNETKKLFPNLTKEFETIMEDIK